MLGLAFGVALRKVRDFLWKINLTMKIIPIEMLPKDQISELNKFFKNQWALSYLD